MSVRGKGVPGAEGAAGSTGHTQAWRLPKRPPRTHPACPVPASRAKLTMLNTVSKIRGQVKNPGYPQSEGLLGECMIDLIELRYELPSCQRDIAENTLQ